MNYSIEHRIGAGVQQLGFSQYAEYLTEAWLGMLRRLSGVYDRTEKMRSGIVARRHRIMLVGMRLTSGKSSLKCITAALAG
jgi:hypothetical protein